MKVIIPAAGKGLRLQPMTYFSPKCLVEINGKPLLYYLLSSLKTLGVTDVTIVTGYMHAMIEEYVASSFNFPSVTCINNDHFESTNSIVSISLTRHLWDGEFCIIDSDLLVRPPLLEQLILNNGTYLIVDNSKPAEAIDMKVQVQNARFIFMDKMLRRKDTFGEFFGLSRWDPESSAILSTAIDSYLARGETNVWYEYAIRDMATNYSLPIRTCSSEMWCEIDTAEDYSKAIDFATKWRDAFPS
ncbi:phosphocholine cytidylyltransferase family protein [Puia dinghuensis]|uniref:Nucleotidyltransferase n=1 Tax=Puia dinghuensis TaxID=1792502 RepID=A0A8J2XST4_9BACT|nr:phosphocholine cytidylyltransferase family protein [Puia dinghuensis]GGA93255.1 nucleotidyltransferase [Puia dinghuensis]